MLAGIAVILALAGFGVTYHKEIWAVLSDETARHQFISYVRNSGFTGICAFLGLQVLQVVVAVLPGEPVELMAGILYGTWGGLAMCLVGTALGSAAIYYFIKLFGANSVDPALLYKYRFLRDEAHVHFFLFLLFFIPGTPKDMLIYMGPFLPVRARNFFLISTFARIPSMITSTFAGANVAVGNWGVTLAVYLITGAAALICIWQQERILEGMARMRKKYRQKKI